MPSTHISGLSPSALNALMEYLPVGLIVASAANLEVVAISEPACQLLGRPREHLIGKPIPDIFSHHTVFSPSGEVAEISQLPIARACASGEVVIGEQWSTRDETGHVTVVVVNAVPIYDDDGVVSGGLVCWTDVTSLKSVEQGLRECVATEALLLRESNHRIKNHLQMLSGLIQMEAQRPGITARELANSMEDRLAALAAAHRGFYASCTPNVVNAAQLLDWLIGALSSLRTPILTNIPPDLHFNEFQVTPIALAINEAISNALKHAYPDAQGGRITITIERVDGMIAVEVADEGKGLPNQEQEQEHGLGTRILGALARQLNGTFSLENCDSGGAVVRLRFPESRPD